MSMEGGATRVSECGKSLNAERGFKSREEVHIS